MYTIVDDMIHGLLWVYNRFLCVPLCPRKHSLLCVLSNSVTAALSVHATPFGFLKSYWHFSLHQVPCIPEGHIQFLTIWYHQETERTEFQAEFREKMNTNSSNDNDTFPSPRLLFPCRLYLRLNYPFYSNLSFCLTHAVLSPLLRTPIRC